MEQAQDLPKIRVVVRKRPINKKEGNKGDNDIIDIVSSNALKVKEPKQKVDLTKFIEEHKFTFDNVYGSEVSNEELYQSAVQPLIAAAFQGSKVTCFAYGQTGSGKTHTMMGPANGSVPGMYMFAAEDIFTLLSDESFDGFAITISFYEIYCGKLFDLLNGRNIVQARSNAKQQVEISGLTESHCQSAQDLMNIINFGLRERTTGTTAANMDSSRSHAILQIQLKTSEGKKYGKMSFIDLAGSERGADTSDQGKQTRLDGAEINKSLLALKECIRALDQEKKHTPFRGSKLTQVLKDSFTGGKCKTVMIANVSPASGCCEHTLNTLRYSDRVKELKNEKRVQADALLLA